MRDNCALSTQTSASEFFECQDQWKWRRFRTTQHVTLLAMEPGGGGGSWSRKVFTHRRDI